MTNGNGSDKMRSEEQAGLLAPAICRELIRRGVKAGHLTGRPVWKGMQLEHIAFEFTITKEDAERFLNSLR